MAPYLETPLIKALAGDDMPTWPAVYSLFVASSFLLFSAVRGWQLRETSVKLKPASSSPVKLVCYHCLIRARDTIDIHPVPGHYICISGSSAEQFCQKIASCIRYTRPVKCHLFRCCSHLLYPLVH